MNANIIQLLQSSVECSKGGNEHLKRFLKSCLEHGSFYCKGNSQIVVKAINASISSPYDQEKGFFLLLALLPHISIETFSENAVPWMLQCVKSINHKEVGINRLGLRALTMLIKSSVKFPEVSKEAAKQVIPKFLLDHVRRRKGSQVSVELLECLQACMSEYSGPSGEYRNDILQLLLSTVEAQPEVVKVAARCVSLLARVGGGGKQGFTHKTAWRMQQLALTALLVSLLNKIYEHIDCIMDTDVILPEDLQLTLETVGEKNILLKTQRLTAQFISVAQFLQAMLLEKFPVAKSVSPDAILDVIAHAQKPTHSALGTSREVLAVVSVLPSIQVASLRLLESLILCLGRNLVIRGALVSQFCSQVVIWSHQQHADWPYAMEKPYSQTRLAAYCCLHSWLSVSGAASQVEALIDKLLPVMLADINTEKPTVRLKVGSKTGKGKKKQQMLVNLENRSEKLTDSVANHRLCERALLTLTLIIRATTPIMKVDSYTSILETVLTVVSELPVPYCDVNCRNALYQLLLSLCMHPHPSVSPPLAQAISAFTAGLHHSTPLVKATCFSALSSLETIIHPTAATLYFPVLQEKYKPLTRDLSEESDASDSGSTAAKKRRIDQTEDAESILSIVLEDSNSSIMSVKPIKSNTAEEKGHVEESNDSVGVIEVVPQPVKPLDGGEELDAQEVQNEGLTKGDDIELLSNENKKCTTDSEVISETTDKNSHENSEKDNIEPELVTTEIKSVAVTEKAVSDTDDPEVSQMLMDFKDEINDNN